MLGLHLEKKFVGRLSRTVVMNAICILSEDIVPPARACTAIECTHSFISLKFRETYNQAGRGKNRLRVFYVCHTWPEVLILQSELFNGYVKNEILSRRKESYLPCCEILNNSVWLIFQDRCAVKCGETGRFAIYCIVYEQKNMLRKCGETVRFAMIYVYLQTNFILVLFYTNLSYLAVSNFSSLWELTEGGSPPSFSRAICSTWQGLSALLHTRIWQSSG